MQSSQEVEEKDLEDFVKKTVRWLNEFDGVFAHLQSLRDGAEKEFRRNVVGRMLGLMKDHARDV
jgi:hypothetical protein